MRSARDIVVRIRNLPVFRQAGSDRDGTGPPSDPVHAPGHRHTGPAPEQEPPGRTETVSPRHWPWIRTSHSDSQRRRFRR